MRAYRVLAPPTNGPEEKEERLVGADSTKVLRRKTVRGEARIDRIVLPKVGERGGRVPKRYAILLRYRCRLKVSGAIGANFVATYTHTYVEVGALKERPPGTIC